MIHMNPPHRFLLTIATLRPILDGVLKQDVPRIFQQGLFGLARLCFRQRKYSCTETTLLMIFH